MGRLENEFCKVKNCSPNSQNKIEMFTTRSCLAAATATVRAVKRRSLLPTRAALTLTPTAVKRIKELTDGVPDCIGMRIGVRQRGCNGLSYTLDYAEKKEKFDEVVTQDGVSIYIDKNAQLSILGTEMDFQESKLASEFVFNNPNISGTCGCGESFSDYKETSRWYLNIGLVASS